MNTPTPNRRPRRRRVADQDRKRAPRACDRCKLRKQSCVETASGVCQRCLRGSHPCRFDRDRTPPETDDARDTSISASANITTSSRDGREEGEVHVASPVTPLRIDPMSRQEDTHHLHAVSPEAATSEMFMWPRFLSKLRDAFCLDPQPAAEERQMAQLQGRMSRPMASPSPDERRRLRKVVDAFPPKAVADFLLSVCICHGTDNFYYFDQRRFTSELERFYADPDSLLRLDPGFVCLCLAVFALGSQWTTLAKPGSMAEEASYPSADSDPGRIFYNQARVLMGDVVDRACVRSVQAAFVLGVYLMPAKAIGVSFVYTGLALRKALSIGLHQESDDPTVGEEAKEGRRRLFWAVWSLERTVTMKLNRPRSISQDIITVRLPRPIPADKEQIFNNIQHQIANIQLTRIMDTLAQPAAWSNDLQPPPDNYDAVLKSWRRSLPLDLNLENTNPKSSAYRAVFHLYLNYYFAWIALGKVSLVTIVRSRMRSTLSSNVSDEAPIETGIESLSRSCVKAAHKMVMLFENLARTGNLTRFSFTDFQGCSIATIVVLLAGILERDAAYQERVRFGIDCLRRMAGGNLTARTGVQFVESLKSIADEARLKLQRCQNQTAQLNSDTSTMTYRPSDYATWAQWLARTEEQQLEESIGESSRYNDFARSHEPADESASTPTNFAPSAMASPPWEEAAALQLQGLSASAFGMSMDTTGLTASSTDPHHDPYLPSEAFNDDQLYLMGLTGMDVLNFTADL